MNIIVCNDSRTEAFPKTFDWSQDRASEKAKALRIECNLDGTLCDILTVNGHNVDIFDGYQNNCVTKIKDANVGASLLAKQIRAFKAQGMVYDLNYFGDFNYGLNMLKHLRQLGIRLEDLVLVVYTHFKNEVEHDYPHRLGTEFGIPVERIVDRLAVNVKNIPPLFS